MIGQVCGESHFTLGVLSCYKGAVEKAGRSMDLECMMRIYLEIYIWEHESS